MMLAELLRGADLPAGAAALDVTGLALDSRSVKPGDLFFAIAGTHADGLSYVRRAVEAGAVAIVAERPPAEPIGAPSILVADARATSGGLGRAVLPK